MSRTEENKEIYEAYKHSLEVLSAESNPLVEKINAMTFSVMEVTLIDISKSLAVIADKLTEEGATK